MVASNSESTIEMSLMGCKIEEIQNHKETELYPASAVARLA